MSLLLIRFFSPVCVFGFGISLIPPANSVNRFVSFFALFLILQRNHDTIGCKNETDGKDESLIFDAGVQIGFRF